MGRFNSARCFAWIRRVGLVCAVLLALAVVGWWGASAYYESQFEARLDELRARGVRVDLADFNRPLPPPEQNGAPILQAALAWCEERDLDYCDATVYGPSYDDEAWQQIEKWIDDLAPWFEQIDAGVRKPACHFGIDYTDAWEAHAPEFSLSSHIAETLEWRMRVGERRERPASEAVRDCETLLLWGRKIEPVTLLRYLFAVTTDGVACDLIKRAATQPGQDASAMRARMEPLLVAAGADDKQRFAEALESEFAADAQQIRALATWDGGETFGPFLDQPRLLLARPQLWRSAARVADAWERGAKLCLDDTADTPDHLRELVETERDKTRLLGTGTIAFHELLPRVYRQRLKHRANLAVARLGLAALECRAAHGEWPSGPAGGPVDPFTREPFKFVREGDALRIEAAVPWLDKHEGEFREDERIYWVLGER